MSDTSSSRAIAPATSRLRVVFCLDSLGVGGTEMNALRVAEHLSRDHYDVRVACFRGGGALRTRFDAAGIPVMEFPVRSLYGRTMVTEGLRFARWLRSESIDIVHAHDRYANVFGTIWGRVAGMRAIIASKRWNSIGRAHAVGNRLAFRLANRVLANSSAVGDSLVDGEGVARSRVVVVPNFVDLSAFEPPDPAWVQQSRAALNLAPDALVVGTVANLRAIKDHASLLRAFKSLVAVNERAVLVLMGDGPERQPLQELARELGIEHAVRFAGTWPNKPNPHALFDFSVLTSLSEGFPNSLVEAMAAARPVVATAVGGVVDAVDDERTGYLCQARDVEGIAAALVRMASDAGRRREMGAVAQRIARDTYTPAAVVTLVEQLYAELTSAAPRSSTSAGHSQ